MSDYKESTIIGYTWQRCRQIVIDNSRGIVPTVRFDEEQVIAMGDSGELRRPVGDIAVSFDPARAIPLRDPVTGELTGEATTYGAVYAILYSAYLDAALARDAAAHPAPAEPGTEEEA